MSKWIRFSDRKPQEGKLKYILYRKKNGAKKIFEIYYGVHSLQFEDATHWMFIPDILEENDSA